MITYQLMCMCLAGMAALVFCFCGVIGVDRQPRVKWVDVFLPEARVPRVQQRARQTPDEVQSRERYSAVFPVPSDHVGEHTEVGSREVRRIG